MITTTQWRIKDGQKFKCPTFTFTDPLKALAHLIDVELSWGGRIHKLDETYIEVHTGIMQCLDISFFEGPAEEMRPLYEFACYYSIAEASHEEEIVSAATQTAQDMTSKSGISPAWLEMAAPRLLGAARLRMATMLACGVNDEEDIQLGLKTKAKDIIAAIELSREGLCSFREALA